MAAGAATVIGSAGAAALGSTAGIAVMASLFGAAGAGLTGRKRPLGSGWPGRQMNLSPGVGPALVRSREAPLMIWSQSGRLENPTQAGAT